MTNERTGMIRYKLRRKITYALYNHKRRGHKINITIDEAEKLYNSSTVCPICGVEFSDKKRSTTKSFDRKHNKGMLSNRNVWVICYKCNATKQDRTMKEFVNYCRGVVNKFGADHDVSG